MSKDPKRPANVPKEAVYYAPDHEWMLAVNGPGYHRKVMYWRADDGTLTCTTKYDGEFRETRYDRSGGVTSQQVHSAIWDDKHRNWIYRPASAPPGAVYFWAAGVWKVP